MANLIIGHTDHESARVWVRGDRTYSQVTVKARAAGTKKADLSSGKEPEILDRDADYTRVVEIRGLDEDQEYQVIAEFSCGYPSRKTQTVKGAFRTFPGSNRGVQDFSFVLGSCNISIVKVNNLLGLAMGMAGHRAVNLSLRRQPRGRLVRIRVFFRRILRGLNLILMFLVNLLTGFKQSGDPLLTSPFLKLCALFDTSTIHFVQGKHEPPVGSTICCEATGAKGTLLRTTLDKGTWERRYGPHAAGTLALTDLNHDFSAGDQLTVTGQTEMNVGDCKRFVDAKIHFEGGEDEPWLQSEIQGSPSGARGKLISKTVKEGYWKSTEKPRASGTMVLTDLAGNLSAGDELTFKSKPNSDDPITIGQVLSTPRRPPSFMIHAGDQIYYDFPYSRKRPTLKQYRRSYREIWFEDEWTQYMFRLCPHYMAIDDHDIVDNYARDFEPRQPSTSFKPRGIRKRICDRIKPPEGKRTPESYSVPALQTYREYVNPRHPGTTRDDLHYEYQHGDTQFFVMNTRTERVKGASKGDKAPAEPQMIGARQMRHFTEWLEKHSGKLKFVVTSVPFIAQVRATSDEDRAHQKTGSNEQSLDKWSGEPFRKQREEIIDFIHERGIRNLIFLAGDMHCCYHATMRVGHPQESSTIHELAGGPIYQLRTGHRSHFFSLYESRTQETGCTYRSQLEQIHGGSSAAMHIRVKSCEEYYEIDWDVVRTIADPKPDASPMSGCIFINRQDLTDARI